MSSTPVPVMGTITTPSSSSSSVTSSAAPGANGPLQNGADGDGQMATTTPQFHTPFPSMQHLREEMFLPGDPIFQNSEVDELRTRMESESSTDPVTSLLRPNRGVHTMEQKSGSYNKIPFVRGNKVIKKRILGRRKKELNSLLCDLAKELLTQYTYTALLSDDHARIGSGGSDGVSSVFPPTSEHSNSVRTCVEAMNSLSFRPFRTFLKEHDHTTPLLVRPPSPPFVCSAGVILLRGFLLECLMVMILFLKIVINHTRHLYIRYQLIIIMHDINLQYRLLLNFESQRWLPFLRP